MERRKAILLFREICDSIPDMNVASCVLLKPQYSPSERIPEFYELHIRTFLSESDLKLVRDIVDNHSLAMEATGDYLIIFSPSRNSCLEISA